MSQDDDPLGIDFIEHDNETFKVLILQALRRLGNATAKVEAITTEHTSHLKVGAEWKANMETRLSGLEDTSKNVLKYVVTTLITVLGFVLWYVITHGGTS